MTVEYINPFLLALTKTFDTMLGCGLTRQEQQPYSSDGQPSDEVCGVINLTGLASGTMVVSLSENVARCATATMLMLHKSQVSDTDVIDAVGEIANIIAGSGKAGLQEYGLTVSSSKVIAGRPNEAAFPPSVSPVCVRYDTQWGPLTLELGMIMPAAAPAAAR